MEREIGNCRELTHIGRQVETIRCTGDYITFIHIISQEMEKEGIKDVGGEIMRSKKWSSR